MSPERLSDDDIADRIAAYAAHGARHADTEPGISQARRRGPPWWAAALVMLLAVVAGLGLSTVLNNAGVGAQPSATASGSLSAPPLEPSTTARVSPTFGPVAIRGETPGPEATVRPSVPVMPGVDLEDVAILGGQLNVSCESGPTDPHMVGYPWVVRCEGLSEDGRIEVTLLVEYWAVDAVQRIALDLYPVSNDDDVTDAKQARELAVGAVADVSYSGATPVESRAWLFERIAAGNSCRDGCSRDVGAAQIRVVHGSRGALAVFLEVPTP